MSKSKTDNKPKAQPKYILLLSYLWLQLFIQVVGLAGCYAVLQYPNVVIFANTTNAIIYIAAALLVVNIISLIALLKWKRWGLWGFILGTVLAIPVGVDLGYSYIQSAAHLIGVVVLLLLYFVGGKKRAFNKLS